MHAQLAKLLLVAAGAAGTSALGWAQQPGGAVEALHTKHGFLRALQRLDADGAAAVPALLADLARCARVGDADGERRLLLAFGRLGPRGGPALGALAARLGDVPEPLLGALLHAIARIGPADGADAEAALAAVDATVTQPGPDRQEWNLAHARLELPAPTVEQVRTMLAARTLVPTTCAAIWIQQHPEAADQLRADVVQEFVRARSEFTFHEPSWRLRRQELARAVVVVAPGTADADLAFRELCDHDDPTVRLAAVVGLRRDPGAATDALPALVAALSDTERGVVREATITLGFFGEEALSALPELDRLRRAPDREIGSVARSSFAAIRKDLSPIASGVAELLDATPEDEDEVVRRVVALGRRAEPFVRTLLQASGDGPLRARCLAAMEGLAGR